MPPKRTSNFYSRHTSFLIAIDSESLLWITSTKVKKIQQTYRTGMANCTHAKSVPLWSWQQVYRWATVSRLPRQYRRRCSWSRRVKCRVVSRGHICELRGAVEFLGSNPNSLLFRGYSRFLWGLVWLNFWRPKNRIWGNLVWCCWCHSSIHFR